MPLRLAVKFCFGSSVTEGRGILGFCALRTAIARIERAEASTDLCEFPQKAALTVKLRGKRSLVGFGGTGEDRLGGVASVFLNELAEGEREPTRSYSS